MKNSPLLPVQEGVAVDIKWLSSFCEPVFFNLDNATKVFTELGPSVTRLLLRANFKVLPEHLDALPNLSHIGLVSTGSDNLPLALLKERNIKVSTADGANATAVVEYVIQALFHFWQIHPHAARAGVGIVGCGHIGRRLQTYLETILMPVYVYDPFVPGCDTWEQVAQCPIISYHVSLTKDGPHPTLGMIQAHKFPKGLPYIINTSRGQIWAPSSLLLFSLYGKIWTQDVYLTEPPLTLPDAHFSTPHIAGYSVKGRLGGTEKVLHEMFDGIGAMPLPDSKLWLLSDESTLFKGSPNSFNERRDNFPWRSEYADFSRQEREQFRQHFSAIPNEWFEMLWD